MQEVTDRLLSGGAGLVGAADLRALPAEVRSGLPVGISFAVPLDAGIVADLLQGPTIAYRDEYARVNRRIDELAGRGAESLRARGRKAVALAATVAVVDPALVPIPLPHKTVARLAGLGWIGKCALLVTDDYGSAVRLGTILTEAEVPVGRPVEASRCGQCEACVRVCPGAAPTGRTWRPGMTREDLLDAHACRKALQASRRRLGHEICGMCIAVCPWTQRYLDGAP